MDTFRVMRKTARTTAYLLPSAFVAIFLFTGCPEQPSLKCAIERSAANLGPTGFAAEYTLVSGSGACAELKGDVIGVQQFHPDRNGKPDFGEGTVALRANAMGSAALGNPGMAVDPDPDHKLHAIGKYASMEPSGGYCTVPTFSPAVLELPEVPPEVPESGAPDADEGGALADASDDGAPLADSSDDGAPVADASDDGAPLADAAPSGDDAASEAAPAAEDAAPPFPGQPAMSFRWEWSNLRVRMTAEFPGNVFSADLTVTQDGCTASYTVNAVFPAALCGDTPVPAGSVTVDPNSPCDDATNPCSAGVCAAGACARPCTTASDCPKDAICDAALGACIAPADFFCKVRPRPDLGVSVPSGVASNVPVACNKELGLCVLTKPVSQL
jgi:hypothetical protein